MQLLGTEQGWSSPEPINVQLKLSEGLLGLVGISLGLAGLPISLHHPVHVLTHLQTLKTLHLPSIAVMTFTMSMSQIKIVMTMT